MAPFTRPGSSYWWIYVEGTGERFSTKIPVVGPTPTKTREFKARVDQIYIQRIAARVDGAGEPPKKPTITLDAYLTWYESHIGKQHRGYEREQYAYAALRRHGLGEIPLHELTRERVAEWRSVRLTDRLPRKHHPETAPTVSPNSVNRELDVLKQVLASAVPKYLDASPLAGWKRLHVAKPPVVTLSRDDERRLLAQLAPADRALVIVALDTMVRLTDLLDLKRAHRRGDTLIIEDPKIAPYTVALSPRAAAALDALPDASTGYYFAHRRTARTERDRRRRIAMMLKAACTRAGIPYGRTQRALTFHGLRHTGATRLMQAAVPTRVIMAQGGWRDARSLSRYQHPELEDQAKAAALIGDPPCTIGAQSKRRSVKGKRHKKIPA